MHFSIAVSIIKYGCYPADCLSAVSVEWDATHYADMVPKKPSIRKTKAGNLKEDQLTARYPPLNPLKQIRGNKQCIIVDRHGIILTWYLPGILEDSRQVGLFFLSDHGRIPDQILHLRMQFWRREKSCARR